MADRASRPERTERDVFELDKDDRWQSRLAEARARRAIALQEKATNENLPKVRQKPWEEDGATENIAELIEPLLQPDDMEKLDFSDRVKSLRRTASRPGDNGAPEEVTEQASEEEVAPPPSAPAEKPSIADRYIEALSPDFAPVRPYVPETGAPDAFEPAPSALRRSVPAGSSFAEKNAATLEPDRATIKPAEAPSAPRRMRRGVPGMLLAGVCILAIMPFAKTVAPVEMGPVRIVATPVFGLQPALGVPTPMNEVPRMSVSGEWKTSAPFPPGGPLSVPLDRAASTQREVAGLPAVSPGEEAFGTLVWSPVGPEIVIGEAPRLAVPSPGRLPGAAEAVPAAEDLVASAAIPEPLSELRVTVLVPSAADLGMADDLAEDLVLRGHEVVTIRPVDLKISERNIRFYFEKDRGEAARLSEAYEARLRDFTGFRPLPSAGTVEIWLEGEGAARPVVTQPVRRALPPEPVAPVVPRVVIVQRTPSFMGRIADALGGGHRGDGMPDPTISGGTSPSSLQTQSPPPATTTPSGGTDTTTGGTGTTTGGTGTTTGGTGTTTGGTGTTTGGTGTTTDGTGTTTGGTGTTTGGTGTTTGGTP